MVLFEFLLGFLQYGLGNGNRRRMIGLNLKKKRIDLEFFLKKKGIRYLWVHTNCTQINFSKGPSMRDVTHLGDLTKSDVTP